MWGVGAGAAAGQGAMALETGRPVTPLLTRGEVCVGPGSPSLRSKVLGFGRRGLGPPRGAGRRGCEGLGRAAGRRARRVRRRRASAALPGGPRPGPGSGGDSGSSSGTEV